MSATKNPDAHLNDDAFHDEEAEAATNSDTAYQSHEEDQYEEETGESTEYPNTLDEEEYNDELEGAEDKDEPDPVAGDAGKSKRTRIIVAVTVGLLAVVGIVGLMWKMTFSANGFKAPVPMEPIDVAEKERNRKNQPTDYADEEQMKTMDYGNVNSIYGLALKKQEANRMKSGNKDSVQQNPAVQRELARSRHLANQPNRHRSNSTYASTGRAAQQSYQGDAYSSASARSAYGDPYHANPTREDLLLRAGFNTVKAEGNNNTNFGGQPNTSQQSLAMADEERNPVEDNEPIPGVVSGDQTIMNGTRVMFRTLADAKIRDRFAPKGSILVGFAQIGSNRAVFNITTLRLSTGEAVPVRLRALDPDMNEGLALQSDKPSRQQADQATNSALSQAAGQAAWSAGYSLNQATRVPAAGNALASLGAGLASAATTGRRREVRQKLNLQDGFKVFFIPVK